MGTYNILQTSITCPHCNTAANMEIELSFGNTTRMETFAVGDGYSWVSRRAVQNGGHPEHGTLDGEGYTVCPLCTRDFFVVVSIREDRITEVQPNPEKAGYNQAADGTTRHHP